MIRRAVNHRSAFVEATVARAHFASLKRELRRQLLAAFRTKKVTKAALARQFRTSRNAIYRLLGDTHESSNLRSLARVVRALDARITIRLAPRPRRTPNSAG
jgi:DNA-binding phage protein